MTVPYLDCVPVCLTPSIRRQYNISLGQSKGEYNRRSTILAIQYFLLFKGPLCELQCGTVCVVSLNKNGPSKTTEGRY